MILEIGDIITSVTSPLQIGIVLKISKSLVTECMILTGKIVNRDIKTYEKCFKNKNWIKLV